MHNSPPAPARFGRESGKGINGIARVGCLSIRTVSEASIIHLRGKNTVCDGPNVGRVAPSKFRRHTHQAARDSIASQCSYTL